jgi:sulfate permease, SulP family
MRAGTRAGVLRGARIVAAAAVTVMVLLLDLISFSQLIFSGPLAESRVAGLSAMLAAYVLGSLVFIALRRTARLGSWRPPPRSRSGCGPQA